MNHIPKLLFVTLGTEMHYFAIGTPRFACSATSTTTTKMDMIMFFWNCEQVYYYSVFRDMAIKIFLCPLLLCVNVWSGANVSGYFTVSTKNHCVGVN